MSNLLLAAVCIVGTVFLAGRGRIVAQASDTLNRKPWLRRIPIIGPRSDSEQFKRRLITFDGVFCLVMAELTVVEWAVSR